MKNQLIIDERLNSELTRTRSGSTQCFYNKSVTKNPHIDGYEFKLSHDLPEMYAEKIEGKWYWVNGCSHCDRSQTAYVCCDKHNVCLTCSTPRNEISGNAWGRTNNQWQCSPCHDAEKTSARNDALNRVARAVEESGEYDQWEYSAQDNIKCPHCATKYEPCTADGVPEGNEVCSTCDGVFEVEPEYSITYTTRVVGESLTAKQL